MMELNGKTAEVRVDYLARTSVISADGSQCEVRVHAVAHYPTDDQMIGEIVVRSFDGGMNVVGELVEHGTRLLKAAVVKQRSGLFTNGN